VPRPFSPPSLNLAGQTRPEDGRSVSKHRPIGLPPKNWSNISLGVSPAAKLLSVFFFGAVLHSSDRQVVFEVPRVVGVAGETKRFAEDARFEPARVLPRGDITGGRVSEDVEFEAIERLTSGRADSGICPVGPFL
jgi:hypothetical protein